MFRKVIYLALVVAVVLTAYFLTMEPSNERDWATEQSRLASAAINENVVEVRNIRNFRYSEEGEYIPDYYDKSFDLNEIKRAYYLVVPLSESKGAAHTLLSFEFEDDQFISVSVEIRKEKDEEFSVIKGLFSKYEIMYVVADEEDVIKLRTNHRENTVYMYPVRASKEKIQELFTDIIARVNDLNESPEFYNTISNNCTNNIVKHVNSITPKNVPWSHKILFPAYSDKLAYELGLIDTELSFEEAQSHFEIGEKARLLSPDEDFSVGIRKGF